jgi:hypothetical protein
MNVNFLDFFDSYRITRGNICWSLAKQTEPFTCNLLTYPFQILLLHSCSCCFVCDFFRLVNSPFSISLDEQNSSLWVTHDGNNRVLTRKVMITSDNVFYEFRIFYPHLIYFHIVLSLSSSASNRALCLLLLRDLRAFLMANASRKG